MREPSRGPVATVSSWWPTEAEPQANPFVVDHARALAECVGDVECWVVAPGLRGEVSPFVNPGGKLGPPISHQPRIPAFVASTAAGSWLLAGLAHLRIRRQKRSRPRAVVLQSFSYAGPYAIGLARAARCPLIYVEHWSAVALRELPRRQVAGLRRVLHASDLVVAVSRFLADVLEDIGGLPPGSVRVVENVVDPSLFAAAAPPPHEGTVIAQIADFRPVKDHGLLVDTLLGMGAAELERLGLSFVLVGDGPLRASVQRQIASEPTVARRVRFTGRLSRAEVADELARADWTLLTSRVETSSCVARESLAVGRPVIAPRVGALPEVLRQGDGILYERTPGDLAEAFRAAGSHEDPASWRRRSASAAERFAPAALAASYGRLFSEVEAR